LPASCITATQAVVQEISHWKSAHDKVQEKEIFPQMQTLWGNCFICSKPHSQLAVLTKTFTSLSVFINSIMKGVLYALSHPKNIILIFHNSYVHLHMVREYDVNIQIWKHLKPILSWWK